MCSGCGCVHQVQHLIEGLLIGEEVGAGELTTSRRQLGHIDLESPCQRRIGVVTQTLGVTDADQEEVKSPGTVITVTEPVLANEPVIDPTEMRWDLPLPFRAEEFFVCHTVGFG